MEPRIIPLKTTGMFCEDSLTRILSAVQHAMFRQRVDQQSHEGWPQSKRSQDTRKTEFMGHLAHEQDSETQVNGKKGVRRFS